MPDPNECSSSEEEDPSIDLLQHHALVITWVANESADPCLEEDTKNDLQDNKPDTCEGRLREHQSRISNLIGEYIERRVGPKKKKRTQKLIVLLSRIILFILRLKQEGRNTTKIGCTGID